MNRLARGALIPCLFLIIWETAAKSGWLVYESLSWPSAIFAARGGYGSIRLLPLLRYTEIRRHPKILVGYSDITALQLALFRKCGLITFSGPMVASDFGNNGGLMIGPEVENWRDRLDGIEVETVINGASVGTGGSQSLAGGAMESVRFLLEHCARWGRPLKAGTLVSTGAVTGVHRVHAGDEAVCIFKGIAELHCSVVRAEAQ